MIDLICFSHLRWDFVYQRPQHLLSRCAKNFRVFYVEEPLWSDREFHEVQPQEENIYVVKFFLREHISHEEKLKSQQQMLLEVFQKMNVEEYFFWYYTPMAIPLGEVFNPIGVIYDCMDELSAFKSPPPTLKENERKLLEKADLVFTGGVSLYEAKKNAHHAVYPFPSSIDVNHFGRARENLTSPPDQQNIPSRRFGFAGVIDERMDIQLLNDVATLQPDWHFVMIGPVVKIDSNDLPNLPNIHWLGMKSYKDLPSYLAGWDFGLIPFARNESTEFISPTKTPEYLAGGKPVISTPIRDVVRPYGERKLVHIIATAEEFVNAVKLELGKSETEKKQWLEEVDQFLSANSWDKTWQKMLNLIEEKFASKVSKGNSINTANNA